MPSGFCGVCRHCRSGNTHYCEHAFTTGGDGPVDVWPGAFAEYMLTDGEHACSTSQRSLSFDAGRLTEPLSGAWKGVIQYSQMSVGDDVVVIGVGSIGLLCLMVASAAGAGRLIAIDTQRLRAPERAGTGRDARARPRRGGHQGAGLRDHARRAGPDRRGGRARSRRCG